MSDSLAIQGNPHGPQEQRLTMFCNRPKGREEKVGDPGLIEHWLRNRDTIEFLGVWEQIHNQNFNTPEFGVIKKDAGANRFTMSARKWATKTNGIGLIAKTGKYGGTYAHRDIAFEFGSWLSPEFKLYFEKIIQQYEATHSFPMGIDGNPYPAAIIALKKFITRFHEAHYGAPIDALQTEH